jgi:hypothetical protein
MNDNYPLNKQLLVTTLMLTDFDDFNRQLEIEKMNGSELFYYNIKRSIDYLQFYI